MANICVNSICFVSRDLTCLKELHANIKSVAENKTDNSVIKLLESYCYNHGEAALLCDRRDYFSYVDKSITPKGSVYYFMTETCSAWDENLLGFYTLLREKYNDSIRIYHQSEEEGLSLYSIYDPTGLFFKDRYKVDMCLKGEYITEYFSTYTDVIEMLNSYFPEYNLSVFESPEDVESQLQESLEDEADDFFNLHVFQPYTKSTYNNNYFKEVA